MFETLEFEMLTRLFLAAVLGGVVGIERGSGDRPAGLRTHVLVCTGSALIMLVSMYAFDSFDTPRDPGRIAAQVVSGVGFLGAGTILHEGLTVRGLTTAASLWMVAAVGLAIGGGMIKIAVASTIIMLITLIIFHGWEKKIPGASRIERKFIHVIVRNNSNAVNEILAYFTDKKIKVRSVNLKNNEIHDTVSLEMYLKINKDINTNQIIAGLQAIDGVISLEDMQ